MKLRLNLPFGATMSGSLKSIVVYFYCLCYCVSDNAMKALILFNIHLCDYLTVWHVPCVLKGLAPRDYIRRLDKAYSRGQLIFVAHCGSVDDDSILPSILSLPPHLSLSLSFSQPYAATEHRENRVSCFITTNHTSKLLHTFSNK